MPASYFVPVPPSAPPPVGWAVLQPWYADGDRDRGWMGLRAAVSDGAGNLEVVARWERPPENEAGADYNEVLVAFSNRCQQWCNDWNAGGRRSERARRREGRP